jgi:hypothetical protein
VTLWLYYHAQGVTANARSTTSSTSRHAGRADRLAPMIFVIEIISHMSRVLSLTLRLFGNIFGEHLVVLIIASIVPFSRRCRFSSWIDRRSAAGVHLLDARRDLPDRRHHVDDPRGDDFNGAARIRNALDAVRAGPWNFWNRRGPRLSRPQLIDLTTTTVRSSDCGASPQRSDGGEYSLTISFAGRVVRSITSITRLGAEFCPLVERFGNAVEHSTNSRRRQRHSGSRRTASRRRTKRHAGHVDSMALPSEHFTG